MRRYGLEQSTYHTEGQPNHVATITKNRWEKPALGKNVRGAAVDLHESLQRGLTNEGLNKDTLVLFADASDPMQAPAREQYLTGIHEGFDSPAKTFVLTLDNLRQIADQVQQRTKLPQSLIEAMFVKPGYGNQRIWYDIITSAVVLLEGPKKQLSVDDDIVFPPVYGIVRPEVLQEHQLTRKPNSQVLLRANRGMADLPEDILEIRENRVAPIFDYVGQDVKTIKKHHGGIKVSRGIKDDLQEALEKATLLQRPVQAEYTYEDEDGTQGEEDNDATAIGSTPIKSMIPDYVASKIAAVYLLAEFPDYEVPLLAYPAGENILFAYGRGGGNVDSAVFTRYLNKKTILLPWWFASNEQYSRENPLQTVEGPYRADNDLLPSLLKTVEDKTGDKYVYLSGIATQTFHNRARYGGARTGMIEQAMQSLVGKIPAYQVLERLYYDQEQGRLRVRRIRDDEPYQAPEDHVGRVFDTIKYFRDICITKIEKIRSRPATPNNTRKIQQYTDVLTKLEKKSGGFDFDTFFKHTSIEARRQINFYAEINDALPKVIEAVGEIIRKGKLPIMEVKDDRTTQPVSNHGVIFQKPTEISNP